MKKIHIDAYIPFIAHDRDHLLFVEQLITELVTLSGKIKIPLDDFGEAMISIRGTDDQKLKVLKETYPTYFKGTFHKLMYFCSDLPFKEVFHFNLPKDLKDIQHKNEILNQSMLISIFASRFTNFLIFSQLAIPGSLNSDKGFVLKEGEYHQDIRPISFNLSNLIYKENQTWPNPDILPIKLVWDYILHKTNILTMKSSSNIENGLNAFTYLCNYPNNFMQNLLWAMSGIESLYTEGDLGIGYQIERKAKLFLGEPLENKKILKKLYDFRSRFLHGSMSIPINLGWLFQDDEEKYYNEFYEMDCLASKLLITTIQKIIKSDLKTFKFDFILIK